MISSRSKECPPEIAVELYLAGVHEGGSIKRWRKHFATCPECAQRIKQAEQLGARYPATQEADRFVAKVRSDNSQAVAAKATALTFFARRKLIVGGLGALAAALALLISLPRSTRPVSHWAAKGKESLQVIVGEGAMARAWSGETVARGSAVQLLWHATRTGYIVVLTRAHGQLETVFPQSGDQAVRTEAGEVIALGNSIIATTELSNATLWVIGSERTFSVQEARSALRETDTPKDPSVWLKSQLPVMTNGSR